MPNIELTIANVHSQPEVLGEFPDAAGNPDKGFTLTDREDLIALLSEIPYMFEGLSAQNMPTVTTSVGPIRAIRIIEGREGKKEVVLVVCGSV